MRLVRLRAPGGLENLKLVEEDHPKPRPGELLVRIRASSLNFHDLLVVLGKIPCADGRIPMSDGAGEVIAVGDDVDEFKVADTFDRRFLLPEIVAAFKYSQKHFGKVCLELQDLPCPLLDAAGGEVWPRKPKFPFLRRYVFCTLRREERL